MQFALWRFKNSEGVIQGVKKWDLNSCLLSINNKNFIIKYDYQKEEATISNCDDEFTIPITCSFNDFVDTLKSLNIYFERPRIERHSLSYK